MLKLKQKFLLLVAFSLVISSLAGTVAAQADLDFNSNRLIEDKVFSDTQTFGGADGIQKFLESKNSVLADTSPSFLAKLKEPSVAMLKEGLEDPRPNLGRQRTAAELIWDASVHSGINPQVILVTLNKEQSLIDGRKNDAPEQLQKALDRALGFDCPDATGCGNLFPGFYYQLFGNFDSEGNRYLGATKSLMKSFKTSGGRGPFINGITSKVGQTIILDNTQGPPYNAPAQQTVTLENLATAALYRFTPHVFNGNYNFWKFFNAWFKYPNGTLLGLSTDTQTYIIQNGSKMLVPVFVAQARGLNLATKLTISPTEFSNYPTGTVYGPIDNTVAKTSAGQMYVFINNVKHPVSAFVLSQRGLSSSSSLAVSDADLAMFTDGVVLTPTDGTILKSQSSPAVYVADGGTLKLFSYYTFVQRKVKPSQIITVPDAELASYPKLGFVAPLDGTLMKSESSPTVYLIDNGLKRPITGEVFKNQGYSFKNVVALTNDEVSGLTLGAFATLKDRTFFAADSKNGPLYIFKEGSKHSISAYVAKQRSITPDYVLSGNVVSEWLEGIPIPPRDNTVVKGDGDPTIFLISGGQLRPLTYSAFVRRKIKSSQIVSLPQAEVSAYAKGDVLEK